MNNLYSYHNKIKKYNLNIGNPNDWYNIVLTYKHLYPMFLKVSNENKKIIDLCNDIDWELLVEIERYQLLNELQKSIITINPKFNKRDIYNKISALFSRKHAYEAQKMIRLYEQSLNSIYEFNDLNEHRHCLILNNHYNIRPFVLTDIFDWLFCFIKVKLFNLKQNIYCIHYLFMLGAYKEYKEYLRSENKKWRAILKSITNRLK